MMQGISGLFRRFGADRSGAALIELAFAIPVLVIVLLGCFEATRYVLLHQKMNRAAASTADLVAQLSAVTDAQLTDLFDAASQLLEPYDLGANGRVIVSSVHRPDAANPPIDAITGLSYLSWNWTIARDMSSEASTSPPGESTFRTTAFTRASFAASFS